MIRRQPIGQNLTEEYCTPLLSRKSTLLVEVVLYGVVIGVANIWIEIVPESHTAIKDTIDNMNACLNPAATTPEETFPATRPLITAINITGGRKKWINSAREI